LLVVGLVHAPKLKRRKKDCHWILAAQLKKNMAPTSITPLDKKPGPGLLLLATDPSLARSFVEEGYVVLESSACAVEDSATLLLQHPSVRGTSVAVVAVGTAVLPLLHRVASSSPRIACCSAFCDLEDLGPDAGASVLLKARPTVPFTLNLFGAPRSVLPASLFAAEMTNNLEVYNYDSPLSTSAITTGLPWSRGLGALRRTVGPFWNLSELCVKCHHPLSLEAAHERTRFSSSRRIPNRWDLHCQYEFETRDCAKTMDTMVSEPYVNHM
jgi:hypothetical protein